LTLKFQLISSAALGLVGASLANGQAQGTSYNYAEFSIQGATTINGNSVGGIYTSGVYYFYGFGGPSHGNYGQYAGGIGNYSYLDDVGHDPNGQSGQAFASNSASPSGQVISNDYMVNTARIYNSNPFGVFVDFTGFTESYASASQDAAGNSAFGEGNAELLFNYRYVFQSTGAAVEADNLFGVGNFGDWYKSSYQGSSDQQYFFASGSPFSDGILAIGIYHWSYYVGAYRSFLISEDVHSYGAATSIAQKTNGTPGPAAVAPFAIGLIGALRRRKKS
jgi:hypothetical protein